MHVSVHKISHYRYNLMHWLTTEWTRLLKKKNQVKKNRPQLDDLLKVLRKGDTVVVYKLDRISRSTKHLIELMEHFEAKGIHFVSPHSRQD
jgi:DNA invertase Pin-like site-specific DNA recombinase